MHLLAAKPGGFVDDEGIVDLGQTPAELVILAAADSVLGALGSALDQIIAFHGTDDGWDNTRLPSVPLAHWMQLIIPSSLGW
mgnify:CR=1 FL=1